MTYYLACDEKRRVKGVGVTQDAALCNAVNPLKLTLLTHVCTGELYRAVMDGTLRSWRYDWPGRIAWLSKSKPVFLTGA